MKLIDCLHDARNPFDYQLNQRERSASGKLCRQRGMTLIELMVALVLGLILIGGILNIFITNSQTFKVNENLARMQENARIAFDLMARDVREAGLNPCGTRMVANVVQISSATPWWANWSNGTIQGFDDSQDVAGIVAFGTSEKDRVSGTDAMLTMHAGQNEQVIISHDTGSHEITLKAVTGLAEHDILMACDMSSAAIFQADSVSPSLKLIDHSKSITNMNCSSSLGYPTPASCTPVAVKEFQPGGMVSKLVSTFWYVGYNASGKRSLYRTRIRWNGTSVAAEPEEMFPGVQDLQIEYLTKTASTLAADWVKASNTIFDSASGDWKETNPAQVVAARLNLTLQSDENVSTTNLPIQRQLIHVVGLRGRDTL